MQLLSLVLTVLKAMRARGPNLTALPGLTKTGFD